jgi:type IV fimbrial biogenesis protein FimT
MFFPPHARHSRAYTLYELLLTLALIAILAGLGIPALSRIGARSAMHGEINALFHALHLARKESVMRRRVVSLCPSNDFRRCAPADDWSFGWLMFENSDRDSPPQRDPAEALLQVHKVHPNVRITANRRGFTLRSTQLRATNGTFVICDRGARVDPVGLVVSYTGRPRVSEIDPRGAAYFCAD